MKKFNLVLPLAACAMAVASLSACSKTPDDSETADTAAPAAADPAPVAAAGNAATPAATVTLASLTPDATKGAAVFKQCAACHSVKEGENRVGPSMHAIVGRTSGQVAGYSYSTANKTSGVVWSKDVLFQYLEAPRKFMPGTKMSFAGLTKPQDRADVIAYLETL